MTTRPDDVDRVDVTQGRVDTRKAGAGPGATAPDTTAGADPKRWLALMVIAIAQLMVVLDASIVNVALPAMERDLKVTQASGQWVITAYTLAFGGLLLFGGRVADYVGRKRMFIVGLIGFAAASALGGAATSGGLLFGARALQGAFAAMLAPAALSLLTVTFTDARERARAFGVYGAISGGGAAIGLILGGLLTEYSSWRWCLYVNVPIAIIAAVAAVPLVRESKADGDRTYDIPGAVLVTAGLVALVYGFTEAAKTGVGWTSATTLTLLAVAVVLLVGFVLVEIRTAQPLLPMRIVLDRNRGAAYLTSLLIGAGLFAMFLFLTYYFQFNLGYTPLKAGFAFLPFSGGIILSAGLASSLLPRFGPKPLMIIGGVLGALGMFRLVAISDTSSWAAVVLPAEIFISIGMGLIFVPLSSLALFGIGGRDAGVASAMLNTTQQVGGALGTALLTTLYAGAVTRYLTAHPPRSQAQLLQSQHLAFLRGYWLAFIVGGSLLLLATLVTTVFVRARKDDVAVTEGAIVA